ncbi:transposase [Deinococcus sp. YIM 77859]|uniref:transposase n=1 Tax=Deinococcus sp. YIM 77859 TaxID=1540221 RepID=UPI0012DFEF16|nr:transposase [Deinococcus sp. YIM 77859]
MPLVSRVIEHPSAQVSTAQLLPVLAEVKGLLDFLGLRQVRLLADRGFCDTEWMAWLRVCGWHYRIRIKSSLILAGCVGWARCGSPPELWQVVSDEPTSLETFAEYGQRFQIEEGFLDDKSGLFGLENSKLRDAASLERLVLVLSVATLLLVSKGLHEGARRRIDPHWQRGLSYLKLGLRAVQYALSRGQAVFTRLTLPGGPDPELPRTSKLPTPLITLEVG